MKKYIYILIIFFSEISSLFSQTIISNLRSSIELGTYLSTSGQNPFWLRSNQYGIVPLESQFITLRGSTYKEFDSTKTKNNKISKFGYGYGASTAINVGKVNQIYLPEAYIKIRFGAFEFYGGRRKEIVGLVDTTLTSGSYIWSGNALPLPKLQLSIPNYTSIIGKGLISIKGSYSHGWFGTQGNTKNFFLHQKTLYGRIGKPNWKVKFYGGFNHQVQWGGRPLKPYIESQTGKLITTYGNDFETYLDVISGISLNTKGGTDIPGVPINDAWNRTGNHLGSIDIGTEINFNKFDLLVYRQSIYDDGSLYYLNNISDGLLGISIKRKNIVNGLIGFNFEYLNTTNQGGNGGSDNTIPELRGMDNYFNNGLYAWAYQGNTIGTPFISSIDALNSNLYRNYEFLLLNLPTNFMINNRVQGITFSTNHKYLKFQFNSKISYFNNRGIYGNEINVKQLSILENIQFPFKEYFIDLSISYDSNGLFKSNLGSKFSIKRFF